MTEERDRALRDLLVINAGLGICTPEEGYDSLKWAVDDLRRGIDPLVAERDRLREALEAAERVMSQNIYPKPDVGPEHPYSVLLQVRKALEPFDFASEARLWGEAEARVMEAEYNLTRAVAALTHAARAAGREQAREAEERAQQTQAVAALFVD